MPTWGEILNELKDAAKRSKKVPFDNVRRKYLAELHKKTERDIILYASDWMDPPAPPGSSINIGDIQGLMEVIHKLKGKELDFILHSPGGSAEAAEAIISYLRKKFSDIRVIIPYAAMSAATMLACGSDRILMGKHSYIGPIDPQFVLQTSLGTQMVPAQAVLDQFKLAKEECEDPAKAISWIPILPQYGPALLTQCLNAQTLSKELVKDWLSTYMFKFYDDREERAQELAEYLANHQNFKSHSRFIDRNKAKEIGLLIDDLEEDEELQDLVLSVFHAAMHTLQGTPTTKIIENHLGKALVRKFQQIPIPLFQPPVQPPVQPPPQPPDQSK